MSYKWPKGKLGGLKKFSYIQIKELEEENEVSWLNFHIWCDRAMKQGNNSL